MRRSIDATIGNMKEIHKKIDKKYFDLIASGQKTFEIRVADFACEPGDILVLDEYEYGNGGLASFDRLPTGRQLKRRVGWVGKTKGAAFLERPDVKADAEKYGLQVISLLEEVN